MNRMPKYFAVLFIFTVILPVLFLSSSDTQATEDPIPIHHWLTQNGVATYFVPTEGLPMVDIVVTLNAGSARDEDKFGLSSLTASLLDKGTQNRSAEGVAKGFEEVGALFHAEADRDKVFLSLRSLTDPSILSTVVELFSEVLGKPAFTEDSVQQLKNQTLVSLKKELQQPNIIASKAFFQDVYRNHPYGHLVSGDLESIPRIYPADIIRFHRTYFVAENAIINIVGSLSTEQAKSLAEKIANALPKGKKASPLPKVLPLKTRLEDRIVFPSEQTHILLGQACLVANDPDFFPLLVGNYILGEGMLVARLFKEVRDKHGLVYNIVSRFKRFQQPGPFIIQLQTQKAKAPEAIQRVEDTLIQFIKDGPTEAEVIAAKKGIIGRFPLSIGNNAQIAGVVSELTFYGLPLDFLHTFRSQVAKVTREDIQRAFKKRLDPDKMVLVSVGG